MTNKILKSTKSRAALPELKDDRIERVGNHTLDEWMAACAEVAARLHTTPSGFIQALFPRVMGVRSDAVIKHMKREREETRGRVLEVLGYNPADPQHLAFAEVATIEMIKRNDPVHFYEIYRQLTEAEVDDIHQSYQRAGFDPLDFEYVPYPTPRRAEEYTASEERVRDALDWAKKVSRFDDAERTYHEDVDQIGIGIGKTLRALYQLYPTDTALIRRLSILFGEIRDLHTYSVEISGLPEREYMEAMRIVTADLFRRLSLQEATVFKSEGVDPKWLFAIREHAIRPRR